MFHIRQFRNTDVPGIVDVWNKVLAGPNVAQPLKPNEFEILVFSRPYFLLQDLFVAEDQASGKIIGFAHCGFGPDDPVEFCCILDRSMGTIAMLCCPAQADLEDALIGHCINHMKSLGTQVIYAGGRYPLNPFYWSIYGGSEFSGFLESHQNVHPALLRNHFTKTAESVLFEYNLAKSEPRHVKNALLRRESRLVILEDENPRCLWTTLAIEIFHPLIIQVNEKNSEKSIARSTLWPMSMFGKKSDQSRIGLIDVWVDQEQRRRGYGRFIVTEAIKCAMELSYDVLCVQTDATNDSAIKLYESLGFERIESARFYRLNGSSE